MAAPVDYDLIIVGGGMVGASLAIALADTPLRIALLEAVPFRSQGQPSYDDRAIALAYGTRRIFAGMGLWPALAQDVTPIANIHISDRGHFGATHLDSRDSGAEALGYVVESRALGAVIAERLQCVGNVSVHCPATVTHVALGSECAAVTVKLDETEQRQQHTQPPARQPRVRTLLRQRAARLAADVGPALFGGVDGARCGGAGHHVARRLQFFADLAAARRSSRGSLRQGRSPPRLSARARACARTRAAAPRADRQCRAHPAPGRGPGIQSRAPRRRGARRRVVRGDRRAPGHRRYVGAAALCRMATARSPQDDRLHRRPRAPLREPAVAAARAAQHGDDRSRSAAAREALAHASDHGPSRKTAAPRARPAAGCSA